MKASKINMTVVAQSELTFPRIATTKLNETKDKCFFSYLRLNSIQLRIRIRARIMLIEFPIFIKYTIFNGNYSISIKLSKQKWLNGNLSRK